MQKLKNSVVDRMTVAHLTKAEVDFLLEVAHYQDDKGRIYGVYYKKICDTIKISFETFYVTMESLAKRGLIRKEKAAYGDFDITINGNDFSYPGALQEGYIDVGQHEMFYDDGFKLLKAGEKLLALQILKIAGANKKYCISAINFFEKYARLLAVTKRTIKAYLQKIQNFFVLIRDNRLFSFKIKRNDKIKQNKPTDLENLSHYLTYVACRRNRAVGTQKQVIDTRLLIKQYNCRLKADMAYLFLQAVKSSIEKLNADIPNKYKWIRELRPALIHKILLQKI